MAKVPEIDWNDLEPEGGRYTPPPPALDDDDAYIPYRVTMPKPTFLEDDDGYLVARFEPIKLPNGHEMRFTDVSTKPWPGRKEGERRNNSKAIELFRAAGVMAQPTTEAQYQAAFTNQVAGRQVLVTIDWRGKNKETGEQIRGYQNFPSNGDGGRKAVVRQGDAYVDLDGEAATLQGEVLFANARVKRFVSQK